MASLVKRKCDATVAADWLATQTRDQFTPRTLLVSEILAKVLKPQPRDSAKKRALREVVYHWVWKACATL